MQIILDENENSLPINKPITGKILINSKEPFDGTSVTLSVVGYTRSQYSNTAAGSDNFGQKPNEPAFTTLAKSLLNITFPVTNLDRPLIGQSEYPFCLILPDEVSESVMVQLDQANMSTTFYLKAQVEPKKEAFYANLKDKTSILRTDMALYLYKPIGAEEVK